MSEELKIKMNCATAILDDPVADDVKVDFCSEAIDGAPVMTVTFSRKYIMSFVEP